MLTTKKKQKVIKDSQIHEKDTGSSVVQVSVLTEKINELAQHLKKNKKDNHSRKGLLMMVEKRKKHLNFLKKKDEKGYKKALKKVK